MADQKLTSKGSLTSFDDADLIHVVDVSDTTSSAQGTSKKSTFTLLKESVRGTNYEIVNTVAELDALITAVADGVWLINADITLDGDKVIPPNVRLEFRNTKFTGAFQITFNNTEIQAIGQCFTSDQTFAGSIDSNINAEWFGALRDGTTDDTVAVNAALEMINDLGEGVLELLTGTYYIDSRKPTLGYCLEVFSNTEIIGQGKFLSILKVGDNVVVDTALIVSNSASNLAFRHFQIDGNKTRMVVGDRGTSEDEGIDVKGGGNVTITHLYIHDCATDGLDIDQVSNVGDTLTITECIIEDNGGIGIHNNYDDTLISMCIVKNNGHDRLANGSGQVAADACGVDIKGDFGTISNCVIVDNARGINIATINNPSVLGNTLDNNGDYNITVGSIIGGSGPVDPIISDNNIRNSKYGIYVTDNQGTLYVYNNHVIGTVANATGFYVVNSNRFDLIGGSYGTWYGVEIQAVDNLSRISTTFTGSQSGIRVLTGASGNVLIENCVDDVSTGTAAVDLRGLVNGCIIKNNSFNNRKGVRMLNSGGNPSNITIKNNDMTGATIIGTGHIIKRNTGYLTEAYGTDTITNTNSTFVVSHGLDITPTKISLTSAGNELIWYSSITSTQFTVNRSGTSGDLDFSWEAE